MNSFVRCFLFILGFIFYSANFRHALAADTDSPPRLTVELRDGSRVIGTSTVAKLKFETILLGNIKLAVKDIRRIDCVSTNSAKLTTVDGDVLTGWFAEDSLNLKTGFGNTDLPVKLIRSAQITSTGHADAQLPGLVALWSGEGNASDLLNENNGIMLDGVSFESGKVGQAFHFNGSDNSFVKVADSPALRLTDTLTIAFWFKKLQTSGRPYGEYIINKGGDWTRGALNYGVALSADEFGNGLAFLFAGGNRQAGYIRDANWHHCVITAVKGQADPAIYIDGVFQPITRREGGPVINLYSSTDPLYIGAQLDPASGYFYYSNTLVDELAIYNRVLSASEIQALCSGQNGGTLPPPPATAPGRRFFGNPFGRFNN